MRGVGEGISNPANNDVHATSEPCIVPLASAKSEIGLVVHNVLCDFSHFAVQIAERQMRSRSIAKIFGRGLSSTVARNLLCGGEGEGGSVGGKSLKKATQNLPSRGWGAMSPLASPGYGTGFEIPCRICSNRLMQPGEVHYSPGGFIIDLKKNEGYKDSLEHILRKSKR